MRRATAQDFSWVESATRYKETFRRVVQRTARYALVPA